MTDEQRNVEHGRLLTILQGYKSDVDELDRMIRAEIARNDKMRAQHCRAPRAMASPAGCVADGV